MNSKNLIREIVYFLFRLTLIPFAIRRLIQQRTVTILVFHNLQYKAAERLFKTLSERYNFMSLTDYIHKLSGDNLSDLPERAIIITLDDGYKENYQLLSLAKRYRIVPTIFICSSVVDTNRKLWFNIPISRKEKERLKKLPDEERMRFMENYREEMSGSTDKRIYLNRTEIEAMKDYFEFQAHTVTHPILSKCSDEKSNKEIADAKTELEAGFGLEISTLAFPNGSFSDREIQYLQTAGYKGALTQNFAFNTLHAYPYTLSRIPLNDDSGINEIIVKSSGLYDLIIKKIFSIRRY